MNTPQNPNIVMGTSYSTTSKYQFFGSQRLPNLVSLDAKRIYKLESCRLDMSCSIVLANVKLVESCEVIKSHRYVSYQPTCCIHFV